MPPYYWSRSRPSVRSRSATVAWFPRPLEARQSRDAARLVVLLRTPVQDGVAVDVQRPVALAAAREGTDVRQMPDSTSPAPRQDSAARAHRRSPRRSPAPSQRRPRALRASGGTSPASSRRGPAATRNASTAAARAPSAFSGSTIAQGGAAAGGHRHRRRFYSAGRRGASGSSAATSQETSASSPPARLGARLAHAPRGP